MPDLQNYSVTPTGNTASVTLPEIVVSGQLTDSTTGAVLYDFTGANAVMFPEALASLPPDQALALIQQVAAQFIQAKAGQ